MAAMEKKWLLCLALFPLGPNTLDGNDGKEFTDHSTLLVGRPFMSNHLDPVFAAPQSLSEAV
jgi:hypothetical protein